MKKKEVQHHDKKTQTRARLTEKEYKYRMALLESNEHLPKRFFGAAIITYQYIMGTCIDDSSNTFRCNLKPKPNASMNHFSVFIQLCGSKNVNKECDTTNQILVNPANHIYYVLLGLGICLE